MIIPTGYTMIIPISGVPSGFLECNGQLVSKTTYANLYNFLKDSGVSCIYGENGSNFYLPDYRGRFMRDWDHGAGQDPDSATRTDRGDGQIGDKVGTIQADDFLSHYHEFGTNWDPPFGSYNYWLTLASGGSGINTEYTGGNETRPKNINMMYCIKT